ncbi:MAG: hypothetical protein PVH61_29110 [Candidatus Aminicenantes bacterium]
MNIFSAVFLKELNRFICWRNIIIIIIVLLLCFYFVNKGIQERQETIESGKELNHMEKQMFRMIMNYTHYSFHGVRSMVIPAAASVFFPVPAVLSELYGRIDSIATLNIHNNCQSKSLFTGIFSIPIGFSGVILLLGNLLALLWGYDITCHREYLTFISGFCSPLKLFLSLFVSRFMLMTTTLMVICGSMLVPVNCYHLQLSLLDYNGLFAFLVSALLMLLFFFQTGILVGEIRSRWGGRLAILAAYVALVFFIPFIIDTIISENAEKIPSHFKVQSQRLNVVFNYEKESQKKYGKFDRKNIEVERKIAEDYWKKESRENMALEEQHMADISAVIQLVNRLAALAPTTFYQITALESSSRGFENYKAYYRFLMNLQRRFLRFYINMCFYNPDPSRVVPFLKANENLFPAVSRLPLAFKRSLRINLAYNLILFIMSLWRFSKITGRSQRKRKNKNDPVDIKPEPGVYRVLLVKHAGFSSQLFTQFSSQVKKGTKIINILLPPEIPGDIKPPVLARFIARLLKLSKKEKASFFNQDYFRNQKRKRFSQMKPWEKGEILLDILNILSIQGKQQIILLNNISTEMTISFSIKLKAWMEAMAGAGAAVIFLTTDPIVSDASCEDESDYEDLPEWANQVDKIKSILEPSS